MKRTLPLSLLLLAIAAPLTAAVNPSANAETFGIFTVLPPLIAIAMAFLTRNVIISLFTGVFIGSILLVLPGGNLFSGLPEGFLGLISLNRDAVSGQGATILTALPKGFLRLVAGAQKSLADSWNAGIILQVLTIGGLISLMSRSGGIRAFAEKIAARAKSPLSAQLTAWLLGLTIFFDDYANALIIGPAMRPVTDRMRISREKLAFIIDGTAAPIAGMALISTWIAYELGLLHDAFTAIGITIPAYELFINTLPYRFYNILILVFILGTVLMHREYGPMLKAEKRARETGAVLAPEAKPMVADAEAAAKDAGGSSWMMLLPIIVLIGGAFLGFWYDGYQKIMAGKDTVLKAVVSDTPFSFTAIRYCFGKASAAVVIFQAALLASLTSLALWKWKQKQPLKEGLNAWISGVRALAFTAVVLILAWSLTGVIKQLGTARWLSGVLSGTLPPALLPGLIFLLGSVISFASGTSYGTMGILMPLAIPLAHALGKGDPGLTTMAAGAVLTGAIFGDHCSPISDTTILSSTGAASDHMDHTRTQLPYALTAAGVALFLGYIPAGFGISPWLLLPVSTAVLLVGLRLFGKRVTDHIK